MLLNADQEAEIIRLALDAGRAHRTEDGLDTKTELLAFVKLLMDPQRPRYPEKGELPEEGQDVQAVDRHGLRHLCFGEAVRREPSNFRCWWPCPTVPESEP